MKGKISMQLLDDCKKGDRKAHYQLYRACFSVLLSTCLRYEKDKNEAASLLNMGFLKIVNNLNKYRPKVPFEAWIRRIMINTIIDQFRKNRKVRELIQYTDFSDSPIAEQAIELNSAEYQFDAEQLEAMIHHLPPMSRKVFNLVAIDGYSHKEVGAMLDISPGTSKWHLSFARKKLREMISVAQNSSKIV